MTTLHQKLRRITDTFIAWIFARKEGLCGLEQPLDSCVNGFNKQRFPGSQQPEEHSTTRGQHDALAERPGVERGELNLVCCESCVKHDEQHDTTIFRG